MPNQTLGHDIQTESVALKLIEHDKPISFTSWDNVHKTKDFIFNQTKDFQNVHPGEEAGGRKPGEKRVWSQPLARVPTPCCFIVTGTLVLDKELRRGQLPAPCIEPPVLSRGQPWAPHPGFCWAQPRHPDLAGIQGPGRNPEASFITPLAFEEVHLYKLIKTGTK